MDYHEILGIPKNAPREEIRSAYRRLAKIWHPDNNPSPEAEEQFRIITEAYDALMNEQQSFRAFTSPFVPKAATTEKNFAEEREWLRHRNKVLIQKMRLLRFRAEYNIMLVSKFRAAWKFYFYFIALTDGLLSLAFLLSPLPVVVLTGKFIYLLLFIGAFPPTVYFGFCAKKRLIHARMLFGADHEYLHDEIDDYFFFDNRRSIWPRANRAIKAS